MPAAAALSSPRTCAVVAAALLTVAGSNAAEPRRPKGRHHLGPISLTPRVEVRSGIDTNVFQRLEDPTRDGVVIVSPRLDGGMSVGRRLTLTGSGLLDYNYYRRQGDERSKDFSGEGAAEFRLGRLTLFGGGGGGQFTQRFSIDIDERLKRQEKRGNVGASFRPTSRLTATVRGTGEVFTFAPGAFRLGGDIKSSLDRNTLTGAAEARYKLSSRTTFVGTAESIEDRFFSAPISTPRARRSQRYLAGFEFSPRAAISGKVMVGLRRFSGTLDQGSPGYQGSAVSADLTLPVGSFSRVRFRADRDVFFASTLVTLGAFPYRNAFVLKRYGADATLRLPASFIGLASVGFEESKYLLPHPYGNPLFFADRVDHRFTGSAGLVRPFGDRLRLGGYASWARRVSSLPLFSYEAVRYGVSAEVTP